MTVTYSLPVSFLWMCLVIVGASIGSAAVLLGGLAYRALRRRRRLRRWRHLDAGQFRGE